ncbi:hypothetical protein Droror1_Dr00003938 [Drosera rotundifolia]
MFEVVAVWVCGDLMSCVDELRWNKTIEELGEFLLSKPSCGDVLSWNWSLILASWWLLDFWVRGNLCVYELIGFAVNLDGHWCHGVQLVCLVPVVVGEFRRG